MCTDQHLKIVKRIETYLANHLKRWQHNLQTFRNNQSSRLFELVLSVGWNTQTTFIDYKFARIRFGWTASYLSLQGDMTIYIYDNFIY